MTRDHKSTGGLLVTVVLLGTVLLLGQAEQARAVDCFSAGSANGATCFLEELIEGADFTIDDKIFENWSLQLLAGTLLMDPSLIQVEAINEPFNPGFRLVDVGGTWEVEDGEDLINQLFFDLRVLDGTARIVDADLIAVLGDLEQGDEAGTAGEGRVSTAEFLTDAGSNSLANIGTFCTSAIPECDFLTQSIHADFAPQSLVHVEKRIVLRGPTGAFAELESVEQRFSQTVPEPASLVLLGSGLAGLGALGWRRHRHR